VSDSRPLSGPLTGLRILELANETGQFCGKLLGDLGADVPLAGTISGSHRYRIAGAGHSPSTRTGKMRLVCQPAWLAFDNQTKRPPEVQGDGTIVAWLTDGVPRCPSRTT
jgi:hypothetical protein